jgi:hypothetical protein
MEIESLVIDHDALTILDNSLIEEHWFSEFMLPHNVVGLKRVVVGPTIFILSSGADDNSRLLVIRIGKSGVFSPPPSSQGVFERISRVALRHFDRAITIPVQWQQFHEGSILSVFAASLQRKTQKRIYFEQAPMGSANIFAFAVRNGSEDLREVPIEINIYRTAISGYQEAATTEQVDEKKVGHYGIFLSEIHNNFSISNSSLKDWYEHRLNQSQIRFVNQGDDRPIRLRGAAGTGKTQAMAVKCLRDLYSDDDVGGDKTFAFLTHSSALAHEVIRAMFFAMDPSERWSRLFTPSGRPKLWVGTLYELAQERLSYEKKGLRPLSLDGREGRGFQEILIQDALSALQKEPRTALGLMKSESKFAQRIKAGANPQSLTEEIMNEFACILDADGIRKGTADAEKYLRASRETWQMDLPEQSDRSLMLEIYEFYRSMLKKEQLLSLDQMIADFGKYLMTHEWGQLRERDGFDIIFVDEYHYFTRTEAMTLQSLFKTRAERAGRWPLIMAYDLKQSVNDSAFTTTGVERFRNPGVGESLPLELTQVYRSTPEITAFLHALDGSFPAIDLEGEYNTYAGYSTERGGALPTLMKYNKNLDLIDDVFKFALEVAKGLPDGGRQVAVLCPNSALFDELQTYGRLSGKFVAVKSRDDLRELRYARTKCVFSMPEYVAGLQFDTVFLIHLDRADLADEHVGQGARRRYVSQIYLGASRAEKRLIVASSEERGGPSEVLSGPLNNGSLVC